MKRGFRLNGWQRLGIILSILWIPVGFVWASRHFGPPAKQVDWPFGELCNERQAKLPTPNYDRCIEDARKWYEQEDRFRQMERAEAERRRRSESSPAACARVGTATARATAARASSA